VIPLETQISLTKNLIGTYMAIAKGISGTESISGNGWTGVINAFAHPICNFAICDNTDDLDAPELAKYARSRHFFNVYVARYDDHHRANVRLDRAGFQRVYALAQMSCSKSPVGTQGILRLAPTAMDRKRVADFMISQFFSTQTASVRDKIAQATVQASELELYHLVADQIRERPVAAVMLHRTQGVLGLYNLCVSMPYRSQGLGSSLVFAVELLSVQERVILGLQCDPSLAAWYETLGMEQVGTVDVYGLQKGPRL